MLHIRLSAAILAGKAAGFISRTLGRGGGTTVPGVVARRIAPDVLRRLCEKLPDGVALVAGTNGKTTTTRMLAAILAADGRKLLHNRAGANLISGLTSTILAGATLTGRLHAGLGLFEVDEAALPRALDETRPRLVLLHNLFRDQLDRYGEVDMLASAWRVALERLPSDAVVLLNADDPSIAALGIGLAARVLYYGLEDTRHASEASAHIADAQFCRACGAPYTYSARFYAHVGHYTCEQCGQARPRPDFRLGHLDLEGTSGSRLLLQFDGIPAPLEIRLPLPGLYNALNALAALAASILLGASAEPACATLEQFSAAFGRIERVDAGGKPLLLALIKNPVGASETVRMLTQAISEPATLHMLIAINDKHADGTDVSWLWDAEFERLASNIAHAVVSGTRAADMAVRLKYAGVDPDLVIIEPDLAHALDLALNATPAGVTLYTLPTYTAMLELREELVRRNWVRPFWED